MEYMKKLLMPVLILLVLLLSACSSPDAPPVIAEQEVNWATASWSAAGVFADNARYPHAGTDRDGNVLVVWLQSTGYYANQYHVNSGWGTPVILSETVPTSYLHFAMSKSGYAVAAWLHAEQGSTFVKAVRYVPEIGWGEVETLGNNCWLNELAISDGGAVYLVGEYLKSSPGGWSKGVTLIQYHQQSGWQTDSFAYDDSSTMYGYPQISVDKWGNGFLLWREGSFTPNKVYVSQISQSTLDPPQLLDTGKLTGLWANIKVDNNGNAMALWLKDDSLGIGPGHVYACRYTAGNGWGEVERVENSAYGTDEQTLAVDISGNFYAGWIQHADNYTSVTDLYVSTYLAGNGWQPPRLIGSGNISESLALAADDHGNLFAAWQQYHPVNQLYGNPYIYTNLSRNGSAWGTPYRLPDAVGSIFDGTELVVDPSGRATVIWSQGTASISEFDNYGLFFSRFE